MKTPNTRHAPFVGASSPLNQTPRWGVREPPPIFTKVERIQDPRETAQEAVHQVTPRDALTPATTAGAAKPAPSTSPQAAKGDDDLMSTQEKKS
jgi:hypothetical protein